jgi:hypothetical protein
MDLVSVRPRLKQAAPHSPLRPWRVHPPHSLGKPRTQTRPCPHYLCHPQKKQSPSLDNLACRYAALGELPRHVAPSQEAPGNPVLCLLFGVRSLY